MNVGIDVTWVVPEELQWSLERFIAACKEHIESDPMPVRFTLLTKPGNDAFFRRFEGASLGCLCLPDDCGRSGAFLPEVWDRITGRRSFASPREILKRNDISVIVCTRPSLMHAQRGLPGVVVAHDLVHARYPHLLTADELSERRRLWDLLKLTGGPYLFTTECAREIAARSLAVQDEDSVVMPLADLLHSGYGKQQRHRDIFSRLKLSGKRYFLYPADLLPQNNHKLLLVAFNMFKRQYQQHAVSLVLAGKQFSDGSWFADAVGKMHRERDVVVADDLSSDELSALMEQATAVLFPSLYEDAPFLLHEAMAAGRPILASKAACLPEIMGDGALYFDPRNPAEIVECMRSSIEDPAQVDRLQAPGRARAGNRSRPGIRDALLSVLQKAAREKPGVREYVEVSGIYGDDWAGSSITISFGDSDRKRRLVLDLTVPGNQPRWTTTITLAGVFLFRKRYLLWKRQSPRLQVNLPHEAGAATFSISGGFVPGGADTRFLTIRVRNLSLTDAATGEQLHVIKK